MATAAPWFTSAEAIAIIEDIRANPPKCVEQSCHYGDRRETWYEWTGSLVDALKAVRNEVLDAALKQADRTGDYAAYRALNDGSIDDVICAASGLRLPGTTFTTDVERRDIIRAAIDAALAPAMEKAA